MESSTEEKSQVVTDTSFDHLNNEIMIDAENSMDLTHEEDHDEHHDEHLIETHNHGKRSPLHEQLIEALKSSPLLQAIHVDVRNNSYWYKSRHTLGPKRQAACIVKQDESGRWESSIYKMKPRESDGEMVPTKTFLATHKSRWAAYRKCEAAQKERDANPYDDSTLPRPTSRHDDSATLQRAAQEHQMSLVDPSDILSTHFHIRVVSTAFDRLAPLDRQALAYEALLLQIGENLCPTTPTRAENTYTGSYGMRVHGNRTDSSVPSLRLNAHGLGVCPPSRLKLSSTYGPNTCALELFRVLCPTHPSKQGLHLYLECITPSQWHPEQFAVPLSERYGSSHLGFNASQVPATLQGAANKSRLRLLAHVKQAGADRFGVGIAPAHKPGGESLLSLAETLGVDPVASGVKYKRTGGVYGHFFADLPKEVKSMIMEKFVENKKLIQREGNKHHEKQKKRKKKEDTFVPKTGMSMLRAKLASQLDMAEYDAGTRTEVEMMEEVYIAARKFERIAYRLQRIRRGAVLHRAVKRIWWRKWAAITIQRVVRGRYSRMYTALLSKLRPRAVIPLQRRHRNRKRNRLLIRWQVMTLRMTRVILPKVKKFLRNCFINLTWKLSSNTIIIQSIVRMYIEKVRYIRMKEERRLFSRPMDFVIPWHRAAIKIQRRFRGNIGRRGYQERIESVLARRIDWPRAIKIQRIFRGLLGRRLAAKAAHKFKCLLLLQRVIKAFVRRIWDAQLAQAQLERRSAVQLQRIVRGRIDRVLVRYYSEAHWYNNKFIPAVIYVQSIIRGYYARERVGRMKRELRATLRLQMAYRKYLARLEYWRKWREAREKFLFMMATLIQTMIRRYLAWKKYPSLLLINKGKLLMAAKVILRAWVNFKYAKRMQLLLDDNRSLFYQKKLPRFASALEEVLADQKEIQGDMKITSAILVRVKSRLKDLDLFVVEAQLRCAVIEKEMDGLQPDDYARGWGDAYGEEFQVMSRQLKMANEEVRLLKSKWLKANKELNLLYCELEEVEIELDYLCVSQTEAYEGMRRAAVGRIERRVHDAKKRSIRHERCKWKTDAIRVNVILRERESYQAMLKLVRTFLTSFAIFTPTPYTFIHNSNNHHSLTLLIFRGRTTAISTMPELSATRSDSNRRIWKNYSVRHG